MPGVDDLRAAVGTACGTAVSAAIAVSGGDVARAGRFVLADGRRVFAKSVPGADPGLLAAEADGLRWLRDGVAAAMGGRPEPDAPWELGVPEVVAVVEGAEPVDPAGGDTGRPGVLVLEWIEPGPASPATDADLGRGLARLHAVGAPGFGFPVTTWCGPVPQDNRPTPTWAEFYAERRLRPLARLALDGDRLDRATVDLVDRVADRMADLAGPAEPPARLHGDLWSGNVVTGAGGRPWLVDPAVHGGHREVDLAMLRLFGGFGEAVHSAYAEVAPLAEGHAERVGLWQLAPLLVHAVLFGGGYPSAVRATATRYA